MFSAVMVLVDHADGVVFAGEVGEGLHKVDEGPMAVYRGVPIEAAVESGMMLPGHSEIGGLGNDDAGFVGEWVLDAAERKLGKAVGFLRGPGRCVSWFWGLLP